MTKTNASILLPAPQSIVTLFATLAVAVTLGVLTPGSVLAQDANKNIVVHIGQYSNDLHSATMGVSLAHQMQEAGAQVTIFVDREAVRMGEQGQPLLTYGDSDLDALLANYLDGGGSVLVCPHCAELGGVEPSELRDGFEMGTREAIAELFMNADTVISY
jgi:sulfur relay (sulfurtransferase) complex TusBCD TusD component (DsrE family)